MSAKLAEPLPECARCDLPVRRADYVAGLCPSCRRATGTAGPDDDARAELADWQHTVARIRGEERRRANDRADRLAARRRNREASTRAR